MQKKDKISLEDLLKLKRAERPTESDWRRFDENLKREMLCRAVSRERFSTSYFLSLQTSRRTAAVCAATAAFAAALVAPVFTASISSVKPLYAGTNLSETSLPKLDASYAFNEIPSGKNIETPVLAQINALENSSVRYVESEIGNSQMSF